MGIDRSWGEMGQGRKFRGVVTVKTNPKTIGCSKKHLQVDFKQVISLFQRAECEHMGMF